MKLLLIGNYGVGNIGDEALRESMLRIFPEHEWTVVSARPDEKNEVPRLPCGLRSLFRPWWKTIAAYMRADAVVFGGGSLFTDHESLFAPFLWWVHGTFARLLWKPRILAFHGIGPLSSPLAMYFARSVVEHATFVSVRDPASLARIRSWNMRTEPIETFDLAFTAFTAVAAQPSPGRLVLIPRSNSSEAFLEAAKKQLAGEYEEIVVLLMQAHEGDRSFAERLKTIARHKAVTVVEPQTVTEFLDHIKTASFVLSQRYHGALAALAMNISYDVIPQVPGDKISMLRDLGSSKGAMLTLLEQGTESLRAALS